MESHLSLTIVSCDVERGELAQRVNSLALNYRELERMDASVRETENWKSNLACIERMLFQFWVVYEDALKSDGKVLFENREAVA